MPTTEVTAGRRRAGAACATGGVWKFVRRPCVLGQLVQQHDVGDEDDGDDAGRTRAVDTAPRCQL
jgi:hypothetical protein